LLSILKSAENNNPLLSKIYNRCFNEILNYIGRLTIDRDNPQTAHTLLLLTKVIRELCEHMEPHKF
jgi:hypothetical protein